MDLDEYIAALQHEGELFASTIAATAVDAPIPTCPGWVMRDLVHHQGEVHRWAATVVRERAPKPSAIPEDYLGPLPPDDELLAWFVEGHTRLIDTLRGADPGVECFTFLADAPPPIVFWSRRQANETGMHRVDAESANAAITPFSTTAAIDGIDEMLTGFVPRKHTPLHSESPVSIQVAPTDSDARWHVTISEAPPVTERSDGDADCTVRGTASDIYLALWNRGGVEPLHIEGDERVLAQFQDNVKVRWS